MKFLAVLFLTLVLALLVLFIWTSVQILVIEKRFPPSGQFAELAGGRMHYVDLPGGIKRASAFVCPRVVYPWGQWQFEGSKRGL